MSKEYFGTDVADRANIPTFVWGGWGKQRKVSIRMSGLHFWSWTGIFRIWRRNAFYSTMRLADSTAANGATANTTIWAATVKRNAGLLKPNRRYMFRPVSHFQAVKMAWRKNVKLNNNNNNNKNNNNIPFTDVHYVFKQELKKIKCVENRLKV